MMFLAYLLIIGVCFFAWTLCVAAARADEQFYVDDIEDL